MGELLSVDNGIDKLVDADATLVAKEYYTSYAKYVLEYRALPSVYDGLKPVQRRIIYTASQQPKKLMKTAKLVGATMSLHAHGDCLRGDTKFFSLSGKPITIKEMYDSDEEVFHGLAVNEEGELEPCIISHVRIGQITKQVYHVYLSDGSVIHCTDNHPFMTDSLSFLKASELKVGSVLLSGYWNNFSMISTLIKENLIITRIEIEDLDHEEIMYDFTSDVNSNAIIITSSSDKYSKFIVAHNSSISGAINEMAHPLNVFPMFTTKGNFGGPDFSAASCFTGDTKIDLLDGRSLTIREIYDEWISGNKDLWVYSADTSGRIVQGKIIRAFNNGKRSLVKITLDNNEEITCTPDHRFMLRSGEYCEAQNLTPEMSLMPLYKTLDSRGYEMVYDNNLLDYVYLQKSDKSHNFKESSDKVGVKKDHKIISIKFLDYQDDVYDIEVEKYHNFALSSGVFVHNCRYTELYLSEIARQNFCQFIDYADYEIGEIGEMEPSALPSLIPYCLVKGSEGIAIGLSTKVMPLNLMDLIDYYIDYIKNDGSSKKFIKPDLGYVLLEMDKKEIKDAIKDYKGRLTASAIVTQLSNTSLMVEDLYNVSIDAIINKLDKWHKWFKNDQVGFRNASTSTYKYIFEIYDPSITSAELKQELINASVRSGSYSRILEEDGCAVYSSLDYVVKHSLLCLNKAIDKKFQKELSRNQDLLALYTALNVCKQNRVFDAATQMDQEQLVDLIIKTSNCTSEIAWEITKKPISYLTRSHDKEMVDIQNTISDIENHDRKKYLLGLYKDFRKAILPFYEEKKHSITRDMIISDPRIKFISADDIQVTDGDGLEFENEVYFIGDQGSIYKRSISPTAATTLTIETFGDEKIVGVVTDKSKYIDVTTKFTFDGWSGRTIIPISEISYDKKYINLRTEDDQGEKIVSVTGLSRLSKENDSYVRGSRLSKTTWVKDSK